MHAAKLLQLCLTLCDPMDCSSLGSSVHGILQARTLELVAVSFSRGSSQSRDQTCIYYKISLVAQTVKCLPTMWETRVQSLGWEDPLEKEMATHSSILAWRIPRMEEPGGLQSTGSQRVGHDWATRFLLLSVYMSRLLSHFADLLLPALCAQVCSLGLHLHFFSVN